MLGYLGPAGTFTHQALLSLTDEEAKPYPSVISALAAVASGELDAALVPIENSVEGGVSATIDLLASNGALVIVTEVLLPVQFELLVRPGTRLGDVRAVLTHSHAAAQCRQWLADNVPQAIVTEGGSTAGAAQEVSDPGSRYDAAVSAKIAGQLYGLESVASEIADNASAVTRFVLVAPAGSVPERTGADKTTLAAYMREDHPGALLEILEQFAVRGVNLCRIESRPTRTALGSYYFSIDAEGHIRDARLAEALMGLHRVCKEVVFLGSYRRADGLPPTVPPGSSDDDFVSSARWLAMLRGR